MAAKHMHGDPGDVGEDDRKHEDFWAPKGSVFGRDMGPRKFQGNLGW